MESSPDALVTKIKVKAEYHDSETEEEEEEGDECVEEEMPEDVDDIETLDRRRDDIMVTSTLTFTRVSSSCFSYIYTYTFHVLSLPG